LKTEDKSGSRDFQGEITDTLILWAMKSKKISSITGLAHQGISKLGPGHVRSREKSKKTFLKGTFSGQHQ